MEHFSNLATLSRWAGERFDLVQAAGGNSSFKDESGSMFIKSSGVCLAEVSSTQGFSEVNLKILTKELTKLRKNKSVYSKIELEAEGEKILGKILKDETTARPSIETFLHTHLAAYVLHTHGIAVNVVACRKNWREIFTEIFPEALCIDYKTPGIELALELVERIEEHVEKTGAKPAIIFLQNHGLIVSAATAEEVKFLTEEVTIKLETYLKITTNIYRLTNTVSENVNKVFGSEKIAYLSNDAGIRELITNAKSLFLQKPFCPDTLVYCGLRIIILNDFTDSSALEHFKENFTGIPRIVICKDLVFFIADSIKKARETEEVLKFHLSVLVVNMAQNVQQTDINFLEEEELTYLANWEAEKYRQNLV